MRVLRHERRGKPGWPRALAAALVMLLAIPLLSTPAAAQLLPRGFFDQVPQPGQPAQVEADTLAYDQRHDVISAQGGVVMRYSGYELHCDSLNYNQTTGELHCLGNVLMIDPAKTTYHADSVELSGGMKEGFVKSLTLTAANGATITARDGSYSTELMNVLTEASYSPCGLCIDAKGHRIGWKVKAARITQDVRTNTVTLQDPMLEVLGMPIAWLPWVSLPDPTKPRQTGFRLPNVGFSRDTGVSLTTPYFVALGDETDLLLSPTLFSRQGFLMGAAFTQRFDYGQFDLKGSGIYQLDPGAFSGTIGDRRWRGAIQTSGTFTPIPEWTAGWSYTAFSDAQYLDDYGINNDDLLTNELYATHQGTDTYADLRLQQFRVLGEFPDTPHEVQAQDEQALALNSRGDAWLNLDEMGQVHLYGKVLGVQREADSTATYGSTNYVLGYEEQKLHAMAEADWQKQIVTPAGIVATPFLGLRVDAANYDGASSLKPGEISLFEATPIAAMDVRFPMISTSGPDSHLFEPIAQVVYRGNSATLPGITNDDVHSFVLDDTNIFSYNRFTGIDRQETGLRANIGGRYLGNFAKDRWLEIVAGESFHLSGVNGLGVVDETQTGAATGLGDDASYVVVAARGAPAAGVVLGGKLQVDPAGPTVTRAALGADYTIDDYSLGADYIYLAANGMTGAAEQQEITVRGGMPLGIDYWKAKGSVSWDLAQQEWLETTGEVVYDDGYFEAGAYGKVTGPTHTDPDSTSFGVTFKLKGPDGSDTY